ncbi:hypothetical protein CWI36_0002p0030 [Hamiltosporidium magnivora]|uniref:Uncharacterized protein n=1 Tax=Hamiltosporidium magnivora TaxID=148818 RepID=A0A4Q9LQC0_9MICR|nr:hypothetical protein CWI36_0002p0030 [Hamiltosporidium magnivora]
MLHSDSASNSNSENESVNANIVLSKDEKKEEYMCGHKSPSCSEQKPVEPAEPSDGNICIHMNVIRESTALSGEESEQESEQEGEAEDEIEEVVTTYVTKKAVSRIENTKSNGRTADKIILNMCNSILIFLNRKCVNLF